MSVANLFNEQKISQRQKRELKGTSIGYYLCRTYLFWWSWAQQGGTEVPRLQGFIVSGVTNNGKSYGKLQTKLSNTSLVEQKRNYARWAWANWHIYRGSSAQVAAGVRRTSRWEQIVAVRLPNHSTECDADFTVGTTQLGKEVCGRARENVRFQRKVRPGGWHEGAGRKMKTQHII